MTRVAAHSMNASAMANNERRTPPTQTPAGKARAVAAFDRRAAALRRNLRRRKHQQKDRAEGERKPGEGMEE